MEQKSISLGKEFVIQLNEQGVPISFSDSRSYRYGLGQQEIQSNYWTYPVTRLEHDVILRTVSHQIAKGEPLTEAAIKTLEERIHSTDERYKAFQTQAAKIAESYSKGQTDHTAANNQIEQHAQQFRVYLNEALIL